MRILITGAEGMLGQNVVEAARARGHDVASMGHRLLDITNPVRLVCVFDDVKPEVVVNCAGITKGRKCSESEYIRVNALGPHLLAEQCDVSKARLIHVSTDCVFSGEAGWYSEKDRPDPVDVYGRSKLAGEVTREPHLTVRTSFLGLEGGLLAWLLQQEGEVPGYLFSYWNGVTAPVLARLLVQLAEEAECGLLHIGTTRYVAKARLLQKCAEVFELPVSVKGTAGP